MSQPHDAARLAALGREWIAAWNSHDLERVLALYDEDRIRQGSANHLAH